jgi:hypothetical protein
MTMKITYTGSWHIGKAQEVLESVIAVFIVHFETSLKPIVHSLNILF